VTDEEMMNIAIEEARAAAEHGDVPIGAVVAHRGSVISRRHNERELTGDPTAHAEILALRDAAETRGGWRLDGCTLAVTLEPCVMCAGALVNSRIDRVVFGAADPKAGGTSTLYGIGTDPRLNHNFAVRHGVHEDACAALLTVYFAGLR
jgi:tRNA(adenine34) deaminase